MAALPKICLFGRERTIKLRILIGVYRVRACVHVYGLNVLHMLALHMCVIGNFWRHTIYACHHATMYAVCHTLCITAARA